MIRKSLIAAFIVFFATAFVAMPVASANPFSDFIRIFTGGDNGGMDEEEMPGVENPGNEDGENPGGDQTGGSQPEPEEEDSTEGNVPMEQPDLPESPAQEGSQARSGNSGGPISSRHPAMLPAMPLPSTMLLPATADSCRRPPRPIR